MGPSGFQVGGQLKCQSGQRTDITTAALNGRLFVPVSWTEPVIDAREVRSTRTVGLRTISHIP